MSGNFLESLDLSSTINPDNLRDSANSVEDHQKAIKFLSENLITDDLEMKVQILGQIGTFSRRIKQLQLAQDSFKQAIQLTGENNLNKFYFISNSLRLAHTYHWLEDYIEAHSIFNDIISTCNSEDQFRHFLDFAYQHQGKCYFDQGHFPEALKCFNLAVMLRNEKQDAVLLESTKIALRATQKKLNL